MLYRVLESENIHRGICLGEVPDNSTSSKTPDKKMYCECQKGQQAVCGENIISAVCPTSPRRRGGKLSNCTVVCLYIPL